MKSHSMYCTLSVACAGFILAGAEKKFRGAELRPKGANFFFCPWGKIDKRGAENLIIPRERGKNV